MTPSENQNKIVAVIPFYNEEQNIQTLVKAVLKYVDKIILVNDGSTDNSEAKIPDENNITVLNHDKNLGKGAALRTGLLESVKLNSEITITLDADNQHDPEYIPYFISKIKDYDCVIGSRKNNRANMPVHRKLSNFLTSKFLSIKTGIYIEDSQSGYRAFRTNSLSEIIPQYNGFEAESEMIVKLAISNLKIGFTDIPTIYGNDDSKMKAISTIFGFVKVLLKPKGNYISEYE